ncbi:MAG: hypothetical protein K8S55_00215 [Phycisphaerae bacterium]|nr:hypothetical protein [Phycisphaerae bacterium]
MEKDENDKAAEQEAFVPAVVARNNAEAEVYRQLLEDHDIEAMVGYEELAERCDVDGVAGEISHGRPVLVREKYLDEASEIIADREDLDEFESTDDDEAEAEDDEEDDFNVKLDDEGNFESEDEEASEPPAGLLDDDNLLDDDDMDDLFGSEPDDDELCAEDDDDLLQNDSREDIYDDDEEEYLR